MKRIILAVLLMISVMSTTSLATEKQWSEVQTSERESILLGEGILSAEDQFVSFARGDILSMALIEITNMENGDIYVCVDTYAHRNVDAIYQTVFLDQWDETEEDWYLIGQWDFVRTKEDVGGNLTHWIKSFTLTGYEVDKYYRVRGLHGVELDGVVEAKATVTDGVLITDEPV